MARWVVIDMHQDFDNYKIFVPGDIVELDNGQPAFEETVGIGIVFNVDEEGVLVHWQSDVWIEGRTQKMKACEIRRVKLL